MRPRRPRSDSTKAQVQAARNAALGLIDPPACVTLRPQDRPFWDAVVGSRSRDTWTASDLVLAGSLARALADLERLQGTLADEPDVLPGAGGAPVLNPKHRLIEILSRRAASFARLLHVHAAATVGRPEDAAASLAAEKAAAAGLGDELIPTLRSVK